MTDESEKKLVKWGFYVSKSGNVQDERLQRVKKQKENFDYAACAQEIFQKVGEREKQLRSFSLQIERKLGCSEINSKAPLSGQNAKTAARRRKESGGKNGRRFFHRCRMGCSANAVPVKRFCTKRMCATAGTAVRNVARAFGSIHRPGFG